jgi:hypothetical protein
MGIQGPPGDVSLPPDENGRILYNRNGNVGGAKSFFYYPDADKLHITGNRLALTDDSSFILSGLSTDQNAFLLRDSNEKDLFKIDTKNSGITLAENVGASEYKLGIGEPNPQERVHIANGNLKLDGNMLLSGNIIPLVSGEFNLGSPEYPFKELYLQGDSIVFVDKKAKITASSNGFTFSVKNAQGQEQEIAAITQQNSGIFAGDGKLLTGVPYTGLLDAGSFVETDVPHLSSSITVNYGKTLTYDPIVLCSLNESNNGNTYFTTVDNITRSSCRATFSEKVSGQGFKLSCHVSPRNSVF